MNHRIVLSACALASLCTFATIAGQDSTGPSGSLLQQHDTLSVDDTVLLSPMVVTAARRPQSSQWVADDHTVIDVETEAAAVSGTTAELLSARIPAFVSDAGGGNVKSISLRGAGSERTLILLDGKRTGTSTNDLGDIPVSMVKKIEVVEGGQSAVYGMDAVGGVVNIITRRPEAEGVSGSYSSTVGSYEPFGERSVGLNTNGHQGVVSVKKGPYEGLVSGNLRFSDGRYDYQLQESVPQVREDNGFRDVNLFGRLGRAFDNVTIGATGLLTDRRIESPGPVTWRDPGTTDKRQSALGIDGHWRASDIMTLRLNAVGGMDSTHYANRDTLYPQESRHRKRYGDVELIQELSLGTQFVTTGMQYRRNSLESSNSGSHAANEVAAFAAGVGTIAEGHVTVKATPSLRLDYSDHTGVWLNAKAGVIAGLGISGEPALFAAIGTASRSPTFDDRYWALDMFTVGNPELRPERSMNVDAGFQACYRTGKTGASGRITGYVLDMHDMIVWQPDPADPAGMRYRPENVSRARIRGIHGSAQLSHAGFSATTIAITWNDARDDSTGKKIIHRPEYAATWTTTLTPGPFTGGITCRYSGERFTNAENTARLPQTTTFDATAGVQVIEASGYRPGLALWYDLRNLTNEQRMTTQGYPLPGREHRLGVKVRF
ncbi:MAG: TonB-dependent receptor [Chitinispirillaceae bacterium]|nr:TonB-dependent receptor [Chitinispirillaceae bacterium]